MYHFITGKFQNDLKWQTGYEATARMSINDALENLIQRLSKSEKINSESVRSFFTSMLTRIEIGCV